jgi:dipeptidase E
MPDSYVVAIGGGGFSEEPDNPLLDDYILSLSGKPMPRVCFVPTASGDGPAYIVKFYSAFMRKPCRPAHLGILQDPPDPLEAFVMEQDIFYVGGGNTVAMLATWRALGLDRLLLKAHENGAILCGISAGSICWFESGSTDSFHDGTLRPLTNGLGILPGSHCPHYDTEPLRRPSYLRMVQEGALPAGYAADYGAALVFKGGSLSESVASKAGPQAWRVEQSSDGVIERALPTRVLA